MKLAVRRLVIAAIPVLALAGCGIHEQTQKWYTPTNGVNADAGQIGLRNVFLVADDEGRATVVAALTNRGDEPDELLGVVIGEATAEITDGGVEIPANGRATISPEANRVDLDDTEAVPGYTVDVEFHFANAPRTSVETIVVSDDGPYAEALPDEPESTTTPEPPTEPPPTGEPTETSDSGSDS